MHREARQVLPHLLDAARVRNCVLVGHSDGASIATIYASQPDLRVRGLVLLAPHFFVEDITIASIAQIARGYVDGVQRARLARHHADPDMAFHGWSGAWLDPRFRQSFDLTRELQQIRVPALILQGTRDPYGTEAQPRMAERLLPGPVETVMLDVGHAPHLEAMPETLLAVVAFINRLSPPNEPARG
jgi:pimeloyl-ACP methyl ester carboxylesterase